MDKLSSLWLWLSIENIIRWVVGGSANILLLVLWKELRAGIFATKKSNPPEYVWQKGFLKSFFRNLVKKEILLTALIISMLGIISVYWWSEEWRNNFYINFFYLPFISKILIMLGIFLILNFKERNMKHSVLKNKWSKLGKGVVLVIIDSLIYSILTIFYLPGAIYGVAVVPLYIIYFTKEVSYKQAIEETFRITNGNKWDIFIYSCVILFLPLIFVVTIFGIIQKDSINISFVPVLSVVINVLYIPVVLTIYEKLVPKEKLEETPEDLKPTKESEEKSSAVDAKESWEEWVNKLTK